MELPEIVQRADAHYSGEGLADAVRAYAAAAVAAEREQWIARCAGKKHDGCNYLAICGTICNKCGSAA